MTQRISRRTLIIGGVSAGGLLLAGASIDKKAVLEAYSALNHGSDALTRATHRLLLANVPLAREFTPAQISSTFPAIGTVMPKDAAYQRLLAGSFSEWRVAIEGLVAKPVTLSLAELKQMPARTQITGHSCERGWTAIAQWTGVQLSRVLALARPLPSARYVVVHCVDGWYDCFTLDQFEALHPQTILAYGMNGGELPVRHGAPVRLRVERQLGYKSLKFVHRMELVERFDGIRGGNGSFAADLGYQWYAGV